MQRLYHSGNAYREFDELMIRVEAWLAQHPVASAGFDSSTIAARLAQRVAELSLAPFVVARARDAGCAIATGSGEIQDRGIVVDPVTGAVSVGFRMRLRALVEFAVHAAYALGRAARGLVARHPREERPATIVLGVGSEALMFEGSDTRFVEFCRNGPVEPLRDARWLIVQANSVVSASQPAWVSYERLPLHELAERVCTLRDVLRLCLTSATTAVHFAVLTFRFPGLSLLARDYAYLPLVRVLDSGRRIDAVVITNAMFDSQPLWMRAGAGRSFRVHMVWYAQNVVPLVLAADELRSHVPNYRHLTVDDSWVWTQEFAGYLGSLGLRCRCHVVGPILWYPPPPEPGLAGELPPRDEIRIVVFDVTPITDETALQIGIIRNYYTPPNMIRFLDDVVGVARDVEAATGRRTRVLLKHKRSYGANHARSYLDFVAGLTIPGGRVELVDYQESIYDLAIEADFFIVVPYSSPAYVAAHVGKCAIFYDAPGELTPTFLPGRGLSFASGKAALLERAFEIVSGRHEAAAGMAPGGSSLATELPR